jgi:beta-aspartyl-peptidase (threonine type)
VGDSPLPGAGNYASPWVAASATGTGEFVMRTLATRTISDFVEHGETLEAAVRAMLGELGRAFDADVGFVAVDRHGTTMAAHRTRDMPHAFFEGLGEVVARMRRA